VAHRYKIAVMAKVVMVKEIVRQNQFRVCLRRYKIVRVGAKGSIAYSRFLEPRLLVPGTYQPENKI
jgi:hypothetical protein